MKMIKCLLLTFCLTSCSSLTGYSYEDSFSEKEEFAYAEKRKATLRNKKISLLKTLINDASYNEKICSNYKECLELDEDSLKNRQQKEGDFSLQDFFSEVDQKKRRALESDLIVSQWIVYKSLSKESKASYLEGTRINDLQKTIDDWNAKESKEDNKENSPPLKFDIEDLKIYILQKIDDIHQKGGEREDCLQSDIQVIEEILPLVSKDAEATLSLKQLLDEIRDESFKTPFKARLFYEGYLKAFIQQTPFLYKSQKQIEWNALIKNKSSSHRRDAKFLNAKKESSLSRQEGKNNKLKQALKKEGEGLVDNFLSQLPIQNKEEAKGGILGALLGG